MLEVLREYGIYFKNNKENLQERLLRIDYFEDKIKKDDVVRLKNKYNWKNSADQIYTFIS